jgi:hypothetical protein
MAYLHIDNLWKPTAQSIFLFREVYALEKIHGCLKKGTKISLANGEEIPIEEIEQGDVIITYDQLPSPKGKGLPE